MSRKKQIINTGYVDSSFFNGSDLKLEVNIGRSYLESDIPAIINLHSVDYKKTKTNSLYGETRAKEKVVLPPIELKVRYVIEDSEASYISGSNVVRQFAGDLVFTVYENELKEKNATIRRGDFISLKNPKGNIIYYEVYDADLMNVSNNKTIGGLEAFYKKIKCRVVDKDVFNG